MATNIVKVINNTADNNEFAVTVNGLIVSTHDTLNDAWEYIAWMHKTGNQHFLVGAKESPIETWLERMIDDGQLKNF